jgi:hypothetical protein
MLLLPEEDARSTAARATRKRVSDDRLAGVADVFREGGIADVMRHEHVGERSAYRLVAQAKAAGLLGEGD